MKKEQKQQVSTEPSNVLYTLLCGVNSDKVEAFTFWVGQFCGNKGLLRLNGEKYELMWYLYEEADKLWDGVKSKELPLYTTKQLMQKYYDTYAT